jgi:hypothetical protein
MNCRNSVWKHVTSAPDGTQTNLARNGEEYWTDNNEAWQCGECDRLHEPDCDEVCQCLEPNSNHVCEG